MKSSLSYILYIFRKTKKDVFITTINICIFITTLFNFLQTVNQSRSIKTLATALITLSTVSLIWEIFLKIRKLKKRRLSISLGNRQINYTRLNNKKDFELVTHQFISEGQKCVSHIYYSHEINNYLQQSNDKKLQVEFCIAKQEQINKFIKDNFEILRIYLKARFDESKTKGKDFFNEVKLCLSEDIRIGETIKCHRGMYYDSLLTNEIAGKYIIDHKGKTLADYSNLSPIQKNTKDDRYSIQNIKDVILNNHIGVSTIAITSDNYMVFWVQNSRALHSTNLIVPSGSGSCDFNDLTRMDFLETLRTAMQREFMEESTTIRNPKKLNIKTRIIGHFRWMEKSGKPEFSGVSKLGLKWMELVENLSEVRKSTLEEAYVLKEEIHSLVDLSAVLKRRLKRDSYLSVPLFCNMVFLLQYIEDNPVEAQEFIFK